jgi:hypothetical protein
VATEGDPGSWRSCSGRLSGLLSGCPPTDTRPQARAKLGEGAISLYCDPLQEISTTKMKNLLRRRSVAARSLAFDGVRRTDFGTNASAFGAMLAPSASALPVALPSAVSGIGAAAIGAAGRISCPIRRGRILLSGFAVAARAPRVPVTSVQSRGSLASIGRSRSGGAGLMAHHCVAATFLAISAPLSAGRRDNRARQRPGQKSLARHAHQIGV